MKRLISVLLFLAFLLPATAFAGDGPYKVKEHDGRYIVTKDDGKTQVGGIFMTKDEAQNRANKANKAWKKLHGDKKPEGSEGEE